MSGIAPVVMLGLIFLWSYRQLRENRRRGIKTNWLEAVLVMLGCIVISLVAIGGLLVGLALEQPIPAAILCFLVLFGGLIAIITGANWRWPAPTSVPHLRVPLKGGMLVAGASGVFVVALAALILLTAARHETVAGVAVIVIAIAGLVALGFAAVRWHPRPARTP